MIDISELTEAQKASEGFRKTYAGMMNLYRQPGFIAALCAHEAAHLIFYERMGKIPFEIVRPKIHHNDAMNRFEGYMAAVKPQLPRCEPAKWRDWVTAKALGCAAGGVVGRRLFPHTDGGDAEDKRLFVQECADLVRHFGHFHKRGRGLGVGSGGSITTTGCRPETYGVDSETGRRTQGTIRLRTVT